MGTQHFIRVSLIAWYAAELHKDVDSLEGYVPELQDVI